MSGRDVPPDEPSPMEGSRTAADGTPFAVDVSGDRRARVTSVVFVAGPLIWSVHFLLVYLVAEAGCTGDGPGLRLFDPPVPKVLTLAATAVAAVAALGCAGWAYRRWRTSGSELELAGFLLSLLSFVTILFVGLPALVLPSC